MYPQTPIPLNKSMYRNMKHNLREICDIYFAKFNILAAGPYFLSKQSFEPVFINELRFQINNYTTAPYKILSDERESVSIVLCESFAELCYEEASRD